MFLSFFSEENNANEPSGSKQDEPTAEKSDVESSETSQMVQPKEGGESEPLDRPGSLPEGGPRSSGAHLVSALIGAFIGAIITSLAVVVFLLFFLGLSPADLRRGGIAPVIKSTKILPGKEPVVAVAEKVMPSVVHIRVEKEVRDIFFHLEGKEKGAGSGVIIREDGYILTVNHVIREGDNIYVTLPGEKDVLGKVVGRDPENDIAVIKVDKTGLPVADIGSSKSLRVGETAVAIGSPYSLQHTVTSGIVSAFDRNISTIDPETRTPIAYSRLIQTDAAINPGNSGGALCDAGGEIIGINVMIYSESGGSQGIGFAIPIDLAMRIAGQIIEKGRASHPFIGVKGLTVTEELAKAHDLPVTKGALVEDILADTPADKAGIKSGDIIIAIDNKKVKSWDDLIASVRDRNIGDRITLTIVRGEDEITLDVVLAEKPEILSR